MQHSIRNLGITAQIATSLAAVTLIVGVIVGTYEHRLETNRMNTSLKEQADITVSLLSGLMLESIIIQDIPVLESAMKQAVLLNSKLLYVQMQDDNGDTIATYPPYPPVRPKAVSKFERDIVLEGEPFGRMEVLWSNAEGQKQIQNYIFIALRDIAYTLLAVSVLFLILTQILAMSPLRKIHRRMVATLQGVKAPHQSLGMFASREFKALDTSVDVLENVLAEREEREIALQKSKEQADQASRAKSDFLATMSHEIRTPMNGVIGMAELMLETELDDDQTLYAETISKSGSALLTIINDILDFSKIEAGKFELDPEPFDIQSAVEDVITLVSAKTNHDMVEVTLRSDPDMPEMVVGDVGRIRQILTNIVGNAVKFTQAGYVYVDLTGTRHNDHFDFKITVEDTGIGIPQEKLGGIFNEFEQVDGAANRKFEGTGLGLAISTRLMKLMNGEIHASSRVGTGSVFTISMSLPISSAVPKTPKRAPASFAGLHALIVDDLELNRKILSERLASWGITVTSAASGAAALTCLEQAITRGQSIDLIIQDFQMPEMDGAELALKIRSIPEFSATPLIILSSVDQAIDLKTKQAISHCELQLKPVRAQPLHDTMARVLNLTAPKPKPKPAPKSDLGNGALNILIAEDNRTNRTVIKTMLKRTGAVLTFAHDGKQAVDAYLDVAPDVILMDLSMPEMDGLQATAEIRALEAAHDRPRCPIIALTANAMSGDKSRCLDAGMDDYLSKPINKTQLTKMIADWALTDSTTPDTSTTVHIAS